MKAVSLLILVSFFTIMLAKIVTEYGPDGKIAASSIPLTATHCPNTNVLPKTEIAIVHNGVQPTSLISVVTVLH